MGVGVGVWPLTELGGHELWSRQGRPGPLYGISSESGDVGFKILAPFPAAATLGLTSPVQSVPRKTPIQSVAGIHCSQGSWKKGLIFMGEFLP